MANHKTREYLPVNADTLRRGETNDPGWLSGDFCAARGPDSWSAPVVVVVMIIMTAVPITIMVIIAVAIFIVTVIPAPSFDFAPGRGKRHQTGQTE